MGDLAERFGIELNSKAAVEALELQASLMARAHVAISMEWWLGFDAKERLIVSEQYEKHQINLAVIAGAASRSKVDAAAVYSSVDGGRGMLRIRLEQMAEEVLS
jgi:hypothetical protein